MKGKKHAGYNSPATKSKPLKKTSRSGSHTLPLGNQHGTREMVSCPIGKKLWDG